MNYYLPILFGINTPIQNCSVEIESNIINISFFFLCETIYVFIIGFSKQLITTYCGDCLKKIVNLWNKWWYLFNLNHHLFHRYHHLFHWYHHLFYWYGLKLNKLIYLIYLIIFTATLAQDRYFETISWEYNDAWSKSNALQIKVNFMKHNK